MSELVTNAIRDGTEMLQVTLDVHRRQLDIAVIDDAAGWPELQPLRRKGDNPHGRGLVIIDQLTIRWCVQPAIGTGKRASLQRSRLS